MLLTIRSLKYKHRNFDEFKRLNGSENCLELLDGLNMNNPDDNKKIVERNYYVIRCEKYVSDAVNILDKIMK